MSKAAYAFDETNTLVNYGMFDQSVIQTGLDVVGMLGDVPIGSITNLPVYAEVRFRYPLIIPLAAAVFSDDETYLYARWMTAEVNLK